MGAVTHVTDATFKMEVLGSHLVTVTDFWAEWCQPCKRIAPILEDVANDFAGRIKITKMNVDTDPMTPGHFGICSIPTLLVFRDGELVDTIVGFLPKDRLVTKLMPHLVTS